MYKVFQERGFMIVKMQPSDGKPRQFTDSTELRVKECLIYEKELCFLCYDNKDRLFVARLGLTRLKPILNELASVQIDESSASPQEGG